MTEPWIAMVAALSLAAAAGLDVYLVLLLVALAPSGGWVVPAGLEELSTPLVALLVGTLWLMEFTAERSATLAVFWHLVQSLARPVAAGLLAFLVMGAIEVPTSLLIVVPITMAAVAFLVHAAKLGWFLLGWFAGGRSARPLIVSLGEDSLALGLVALAFDAPAVGAALVLVALAWIILGARAFLRAGAFAHYLAWSRSWGSLLPFRWLAEEELPADLAGEVAAISRPLGHRLKATRAGGVQFPVGGLFRPGWLIVGPADPRWICRTLSGPRMHVLDPDTPIRIRIEPLFFQLQLGGGSRDSLIFPRGGPTVEAVASEIGASVKRADSTDSTPEPAPEWSVDTPPIID